MQKTKIEYLTHTYNPISMLCSPVSEGCENCWHLAMAKRFKNKPKKPELREDELTAPLRLKKPAMIGVQFMGDFFHPDVPREWREKVFSVVEKCPQHTFIFLTKRPENVMSYWIGEKKNIWLGVTCENQKTADARIPLLLQCIAAVRFVSIEPMLEHLSLFNANRDYLSNLGRSNGPVIQAGLNWCIFGAESGPKRRECKIEWVRDGGVKQCREAGVPVFVKQLNIGGKVVKDINEFPEDLRIREFPKEGEK